MKRSNQNSQLQPHEVEELNNAESEDAGSFARASADQVRTRRIVRAKRPSMDGNSSALPAPTFPINSAFPGGASQGESVSAAKPNPFAGMTSLSAANASKPSPFANFTGLTSNTVTGANSEANSNKPLVSFSFPITTTTSNSAPAQSSVKAPAQSSVTAPSAINKPSIATTSSTAATSASNGETEQSKKIKKLNAAFLKWAGRQIDQHPLSVWKDGVQDYIKHLKMVREKYGKDQSVSSTVSAVSSRVEPAASIKTDTLTANTSDSNGNQSAKPVFPTFSWSAPAADTKTATAAVSAPSSLGFKFPSSTTTDKPAVTEPGKIPTFTFSVGEMTMTSPSSAVDSTSLLPKDSSATSASGFAPKLNFQFPMSGALGGSSGGTMPFGTGTAPFSSSTSNGFANKNIFGAPAAPANEDDEGEPLLEPEKVLKNDTDTDDILHEVPCKLFSFDKEEKIWKDTGKGSFRITRSKDSDKQRMLVRNPIGKVMFNANFYKDMQIEKVKSGVRFKAVVAVEDLKSGESHTELKMFMLKVSDVNLPTTYDKLLKGVEAASK